MYASHDRGATRDVFFRAWRNHREGKPLEGIERLLVQIALRHPEYHRLLDERDRHLDRDYVPAAGETNPFLHMGMHVAIEEQLALDEPRGVRDIYRQLLAQSPDEHATQHDMMECLGEWLYQAQQRGTGLNPDLYIECLMRLTKQRR